MGTGCGFGECCWFCDNIEFSLDCVDSGGTGIINVVCGFSCLARNLILIVCGSTVQHLFDQHLHNGKSTMFPSPQPMQSTCSTLVTIQLSQVCVLGSNRRSVRRVPSMRNRHFWQVEPTSF